MGKPGGDKGGEGGEGYSIVQPPSPSLPNQGLLNAIAASRAGAMSPFAMSPFRAIDFFSSFQPPQSTVPMFGANSTFGQWGLPMQQPPQYGFGLPPGQIFSSVFHGPGGIMDMTQPPFRTGG